MKTRSAEEALAVHEAYNAHLVARGRYEAFRLCKTQGRTHSRQVRAAMSDELDRWEPEDCPACGNRVGKSESFLGAVFVCQLFEPTGDTHTYKDDRRNCHRKEVAWWRLRDVTSEPPEKPEPWTGPRPGEGDDKDMTTTLFNLKKTTKPSQCEAMRCTLNADEKIPGDLWSRSEVALCDKHTEAALEFAESNPNYQPSAPLVKEGDYLAGIDLPGDWADNAYKVVTSIRDSLVEAKEILDMLGSYTIDSHHDMTLAADFLRDIKTKRNEIESGYKNVAAPINNILNRVRELIAPAKKAWTDAESLLRTKLSDAAVAENQRNQQHILEAAKAHAEGQDVSEHLDKMTTSTDLEGVSVKVVWVAVVDDLSVLPDEYVIRQPDLKKLKKYVEGFDGKEPEPLAGVRFVQQAPSRVTGK